METSSEKPDNVDQQPVTLGSPKMKTHEVSTKEPYKVMNDITEQFHKLNHLFK